MTEQQEKSPYEFFGDPIYDPRKENRAFLTPTSLPDDVAKIKAFVEAALRGKATTIYIRGPTASTKPGYYELYSNAGLGSKALKATTKRKKKK